MSPTDCSRSDWCTNMGGERLSAHPLRHVVSVVALKTTRHPLEVLAIMAQMPATEDTRRAIRDEIEACLAGQAYRRWK